MAFHKRLKGVKKNRHRKGSGKRSRARQRKSVSEKRKLRLLLLLKKDRLLNEYFNWQQSEQRLSNNQLLED